MSFSYCADERGGITHNNNKSKKSITDTNVEVKQTVDFFHYTSASPDQTLANGALWTFFPLCFCVARSNTGYRLEHRVSLEDLWLCGYEDEPVAEEGAMEDVDLGMTLILAWGLHFCLACFR